MSRSEHSSKERHETDSVQYDWQTSPLPSSYCFPASNLTPVLASAAETVAEMREDDQATPAISFHGEHREGGAGGSRLNRLLESVTASVFLAATSLSPVVCIPPSGSFMAKTVMSQSDERRRRRGYRCDRVEVVSVLVAGTRIGRPGPFRDETISRDYFGSPAIPKRTVNVEVRRTVKGKPGRGFAG